MNSVTVQGFDPDGPFAGMILPRPFRRRCKETRFKQEWKLTLAQYAQMIRGFKGPKRQRGNLLLLAAILPSGGGTTPGPSVVLTGPKFFMGSQPVAGSITVGARFDTDGGLTEADNVNGDTAVPEEWWTAEPDPGIGSSYEVRALSAGKTGAWDASAAADDVWITISANRTWSNTATVTDIRTTVATFEVGLDGVESALDSAQISVTAEAGT